METEQKESTIPVEVTYEPYEDEQEIFGSALCNDCSDDCGGSCE